METFLCTNCPVAFQIGFYAYWDLDGATKKLVCIGCGTMHWLDFRKGNGASETWTTTFRALPEPVRDLPTVTRKTEFGEELEVHEWPFGNEDWLTIESWEGRRPLKTLTCNSCRTSGKLISQLFPDKTGEYHCPVCQRPIEYLFHDTVN